MDDAYTKKMFLKDMRLAQEVASELHEDFAAIIKDEEIRANNKFMFSGQTCFILASILVSNLIHNSLKTGVSNAELNKKLEMIIETAYQLYYSREEAANGEE